jgi:hypothetical protein
MRVLVAELREMLDSVAGGGGGEASRARHTSRGKMLARQRVDLLIDPGTAFLELSPLAAHGIYGSDVHSASIVTGVGRIREGCIVDLHPYAAGVKRVERAGRGRFVGDAVKETVKVTRQLQVRHHRVLKLDAGPFAR